MKILGLDKIDSSPTKYLYPKGKSRLAKGVKRVYIKKPSFTKPSLTNLVVNEKFYNRVVEHVVNNHCKEQASQSEKTDDGHEHYEYSTV